MCYCHSFSTLWKVSHSYLLDFGTDFDILLFQFIFGLFLLSFFYTCRIIISFRTVTQCCKGSIQTIPLQWITTLRLLIFLSKHIFSDDSGKPFRFCPVFLKTKINIKNIFRLTTSSPPWSSSCWWRWRTRCQCSSASPSWLWVSTGSYTKRCRLSLLTNIESSNMSPNAGEGEQGGCGRVSAIEYCCAHHGTWSPNKLEIYLHI